MITDLLPAECVAYESDRDIVDSALFPEEEIVIRTALPKRRAEFVTVRACARRALAELGVPPVPLVPGHHGAPRWPMGIVGSMTHCAGFRAAVVARRQDVLAVGIDAEPHLPLPEGVLDQVAPAATERAQIARLAVTDPTIHWERLFFCAKEAVYKVWSPLTGSWLGFEDAHVRIEIAPGAIGSNHLGGFTARLLVPGAGVYDPKLQHVRGRWSCEDDRFHVAICLPGPHAGRPIPAISPDDH